MNDAILNLLKDRNFLKPKQLNELVAIQKETNLSLLDIIVGEGYLKNKQLLSLFKNITDREVQLAPIDVTLMMRPFKVYHVTFAINVMLFL